MRPQDGWNFPPAGSSVTPQPRPMEARGPMQAESLAGGASGPTSPCTLVPAPPEPVGEGSPAPPLWARGPASFQRGPAWHWPGEPRPERVRKALGSHSKFRTTTCSLWLWAGGVLRSPKAGPQGLAVGPAAHPEARRAGVRSIPAALSFQGPAPWGPAYSAPAGLRTKDAACRVASISPCLRCWGAMQGAQVWTLSLISAEPLHRSPSPPFSFI